MVGVEAGSGCQIFCSFGSSFVPIPAVVARCSRNLGSRQDGSPWTPWHQLTWKPVRLQRESLQGACRLLWSLTHWRRIDGSACLGVLPLLQLQRYTCHLSEQPPDLLPGSMDTRGHAFLLQAWALLRCLALLRNASRRDALVVAALQR